ncbi:Fibrinogen-like protein A,Ryncolin-4,Angiopoietin-related protein 1,Ficolin-3,Ficolin-1-B,Techylectin-5A,Ficolin-2,Ryncolin-1,Tenascin-R,Fibrinogen-like protein 1,Angiopoietin-1,Fibrinogen C domain-containing protein 1-A,Ryncolin-3,Tenascin,Fibroleukin,Fibrinogen C domain-containing protein 1,Ryncolin-2,Angiopoietin-related protein 2,Ficolin-1-A,Ficolin-1,Fibrinogen C domain-containing protein 1-B [Mytilus coruscus]|uniref:Fibrinogen C-terminal domain-containing protein n=1 Tax=Mytilus coruscus TaxID=42192 RepID=A0A6J8C5G8_MYTCO|nr:Fibrinogen-like protein A,Ryncolin-4,Angiopoietin-related protein 1,Ficolin-3,Ficolin-1-B,Techylectin-5A,Ficolin-2,Ryncolin-1,Tenascin-R,Fibrinogen-like protein 1,Angiopoietin-1,Fibrinogen C domain-containing protein 1-A,Ryncolin-3,Tenascin,Fibroleukin,Fibrinogen C domain-containing protein 1,Ryncolin-2,Angiopoietin-related protein 2,Ficolin-1-A,Ficolin-1,Fibrinogen C domain-containing protein 1-B [Mytilus coruscus]
MVERSLSMREVPDDGAFCFITKCPRHPNTCKSSILTICIQTRDSSVGRAEDCSGIRKSDIFRPRDSSVGRAEDCSGIRKSDIFRVVQRRLDGSTDFNVEWANYRAGFGELNREYWIGNDNLHVISSSKDYLLRFDLEDFNGDTTYAEYSTFRIGNEASNYILTIGGYSGTAGDSMVGIYSLDGFPFTTKDKDNGPGTSNCADSTRMGAWWFRDCARVNPNGLYKPPGSNGVDCIYWREWQDLAALKAVTMKIRPLSTNL